MSNKEHDLLIPPPTGKPNFKQIPYLENDISGIWASLPNKDKDYKLRFMLQVKCPKVQLEDNIEIEYSQDILNDTLMVSALVEIDVNVAPKLQLLNVEPSEGVALETVFTFQTLDAAETDTDRPFLYKFGYMLGEREYIFCKMLDYMKCETILPYIGK